MIYVSIIVEALRSRPVLENSATAFSVLATLFTSPDAEQEAA